MTCRIKWEALEDKEVGKQSASNISSKFRQLHDAFEDIEKKWPAGVQISLDYHQLLKVIGKNGLKWRAIVRKEHLGGTKR